jgi:hypothetical protein
MQRWLYWQTAPVSMLAARLMDITLLGATPNQLLGSVPVHAETHHEKLSTHDDIACCCVERCHCVVY